MSWFFHFQKEGKESAWELAMSTERETVVKRVRPAFSTILDLSAVPPDNDWTKVRYRGPYYVDFDADGDLEEACRQFGAFLGKLDSDLGFDLTQARLYASGSKGFHIEIPEECFMPKVPPTGTAWLPYIYRSVSESLYLDTLDLKVYTGKRGRMWRTPNVKRENGMYKVPLTLDEAIAITPELYAELIAAPREVPPPTPPSLNSKFAMIFQVAKDKVTSHMRGKKKRQEKANTFLDPWKKAKKTPPTIEAMMAGDNIADNAGFQALAMQLSIYATSVGMSRDEFIERCSGLVEKHVSDSARYRGEEKRRNELMRMHEYMEDNSMYDFEIGPIVRLLAPGTTATDLGQVETEDRGDTPEKTTEAAKGTEENPVVDAHTSLRRGFFMNADGMFVKRGDSVESVCRATIRQVDTLVDISDWSDHAFKGYEFDLVVGGRTVKRVMLGGDILTSSQKLKQFFAAHQLSYQGGEVETAALHDLVSEKAKGRSPTFVYPREGFFVVGNPLTSQDDLVFCYLTQSQFISSLPPDDPNYFQLKYRSQNAVSGYHIDIHQAAALDESMTAHLDDFFRWNKPEVLGDLIGWFVAAHYRSLYMHCFGQFPSLHIWGLAGTGKSKSVELLSSLHWMDPARIPMKTASSSTPFALESDASSSTSAPMIIDEWKPRELKTQRGKYEKLKDIVKGAYSGLDISNKGTINRQAPDSSLGVVRAKATAPIVFIAEAIESETALFERSVTVNLKEAHKTGERSRAWERVYEDPQARAAISALGRAIVEWGFSIDLEDFKRELIAIRAELRASVPKTREGLSQAADRIIQNKATTLHGLTFLRRVLESVFGDRYHAAVDEMIGSRSKALTGEEGLLTRMQSMSEIAKVLNRLAILSRSNDATFELRANKDFLVGPGFVEIKLEPCYDAYRRYCNSIGDTPLYDNLEGMLLSLNGYHATTDTLCVSSELREYATEKIFRLDTDKMLRDGLQEFRS